MDLVLEKLAEDLPIDLVKIEAEASPEMSSKYNIEVVPSFIFELQDGSIVDKLEGANPPEVAKRAEKLASASTNSEQKSTGHAHTIHALEHPLNMYSRFLQSHLFKLRTRRQR